MTTFGTIREIWRYPVSSLAGERLERALIGPGGIEGDRVWGVAVDGSIANPEGHKACRPLVARSARLRGRVPEVLTAAGWLPASDPAVAAEMEVETGAPVRFQAHDAGLSPRYQRADLHLLTSAAMATIAAALDDPAQADPRRWRPNVVIETGPEIVGLHEHRLAGRRLRIGAAEVEIVEPCARCALPALPVGGLAFLPEVIHAVSRLAGGQLGTLARVVAGAEVGIGDRVELV